MGGEDFSIKNEYYMYDPSNSNNTLEPSVSINNLKNEAPKAKRTVSG